MIPARPHLGGDGAKPVFAVYEACQARRETSES